MTKLGASIIRGLKQALAYAEGTPDEGQYVVHYGESRISIPRKANERALPIPPGEFLREDFLIPLRMTAQMLAGEIKAPVRRVVAIVEERRGLDPEMCLRLARYFRMSPGFWMNVQKSYELETAMKNWPTICKEVPMHPKDRKTGGLKIPISA